MKVHTTAQTLVLAATTAGLVYGQTISSPAALNVFEGGTLLGQVHVASSGASAAVVQAGGGTLFYLSRSETLTAADVPGLPLAFVSFANSGTSCGAHAAVVFTASDSNKCASTRPFSVATDGTLAFGTGGGSFQVCDAGQEVDFDSTGVAGVGCTNVVLSFAS